MHGIHIAGDLIATARKQGKVKKAYIELGEIANITKADLEKSLKDLADFDFEITEKKAKVKCSCGYEGPPKIIERQHDLVLFECPTCSQKPEVIEGDKIILKSVEVE
jgi:Zn finger protein HypA/HybF involved in hydrogenase expression